MVLPLQSIEEMSSVPTLETAVFFGSMIHSRAY